MTVKKESYYEKTYSYAYTGNQMLSKEKFKTMVEKIWKGSDSIAIDATGEARDIGII